MYGPNPAVQRVQSAHSGPQRHRDPASHTGTRNVPRLLMSSWLLVLVDMFAAKADNHRGGLHLVAGASLDWLAWCVLCYTCLGVFQFCFILGQLSVDESVSLCESVASGNTGTVCLFLLPQWHSSTDQTTVLSHRRLVEDKVISTLGIMFH